MTVTLLNVNYSWKCPGSVRIALVKQMNKLVVGIGNLQVFAMKGI